MKETNLNGKTPDIAEENIQKLKQIFPDVFTDGKVDLERLQQALGNYVEDSNERYNFTWNGKGRTLRLSQTPSMGTLRPCKKESKDWDTTQNLYIEGDNLEVLKLLQKSYYCKVKMIYIDPPYNTGGDFVYPDNFKDSLQNYMEITGQVNSENKKISTNSESNGRYHTDWLNMIYPRLRLARNLLTDDGVIFISINENEVTNLIKVCDEIFGEECHVTSFVWKNKYGPGALTKGIASLHEYILCYGKSFPDNVEAILSEEEMKKYKMQDSKFSIRGGYITQPLATKSKDDRPNLVYPLIHNGVEIWPDKQWIWSKDRLYAAYNNDEVVINETDGKYSVRFKQYLRDENGTLRKGKPLSLITSSFNQDGTKEMQELLGRGVFDFPKPTKLIKSLLSFTINEVEDKDYIVLDFFSGSGTAADAVMQLNIEDGGTRKFIAIQLPEKCREQSIAYKNHYTNICEIGKERIRRAGDKIKQEKGLEAQNLDIGFKVLKLDTSNIRKWQPDYEDLEQTLLDHIDNYVDGRTELDVVYEIMLKYGLDLTYPVDEFTVAQKKVYSIGFGMLMICLDDEITTEVAKGILAQVKELAPESTRVVFKDNGFKSDSNKTNIKEILKCDGIEEFITL